MKRGAAPERQLFGQKRMREDGHEGATDDQVLFDHHIAFPGGNRLPFTNEGFRDHGFARAVSNIRLDLGVFDDMPTDIPLTLGWEAGGQGTPSQPARLQLFMEFPREFFPTAVIQQPAQALERNRLTSLVAKGRQIVLVHAFAQFNQKGGHPVQGRTGTRQKNEIVGCGFRRADPHITGRAFLLFPHGLNDRFFPKERDLEIASPDRAYDAVGDHLIDLGSLMGRAMQGGGADPRHIVFNAMVTRPVIQEVLGRRKTQRLVLRVHDGKEGFVHGHHPAGDLQTLQDGI